MAERRWTIMQVGLSSLGKSPQHVAVGPRHDETWDRPPDDFPSIEVMPVSEHQALRDAVRAEIEWQHKSADKRAEHEGEDYHAVQQHRQAAQRLASLLETE